MTKLPKLNRRTFLAFAGVQVMCAYRPVSPAHASQPPNASLRDAPIELAGNWASVPRDAISRVVTRVREVALAGLQLLSDRQPQKLRIDEHTEGRPSIWLHRDEPETAWIIVDVGPADWCKLAYQFGHELGHVLCNSWQFTANPKPPTQWLEEALAEGFSLRNLGLLAASWKTNPPFAGNADFEAAIRQYRDNLIANYKSGPNAAFSDPASWFHAQRSTLEAGGGIPEGIAVLAVLAFLEGDREYVEDLGAVNRWEARTGIPVEDYLAQWEKSCAEIGAPGRLPAELRRKFELA